MQKERWVFGLPLVYCILIGLPVLFPPVSVTEKATGISSSSRIRVYHSPAVRLTFLLILLSTKSTALTISKENYRAGPGSLCDFISHVSHPWSLPQ